MTKSCTTTSFRKLDVGRDVTRRGRHEPKNRASHQTNLAPLICRVVRAVRAVRVLGAGLGFPVGDLRCSSPTSDTYTYKTKLKLDKEVGGGGGSASVRENRTRELEEPVSGPSRRPALEAPQPQTGGGSARERENGTRAREEPASDPT